MQTKTRKWLLALIAILTVVCLTLALAACNDPDDGDDDPTPLDAPTLEWEDEAAGILGWNPIDNATAYIVYENGTALSTMVQAPTTTYTIGDKAPGIYNYQVAATSTDSAYKTSEKSNTIIHKVDAPNPKLSAVTWGSFTSDDMLELNIAAEGTVTIDLDNVDAGDYYVAMTEDLAVDGYTAVSATLKVGQTDYDFSTLAQPVHITIAEGTTTVTLTNDSNEAIKVYLVMFNYVEATQLATPSNYKATGRVLSWNPVTNADYYNVYYSTDDNTYDVLTTVTETTYTHLGDENGTYYYKVSAVSHLSWLYTESNLTNSAPVEISATPLQAPTIELVGNAINWNSVSHAGGYAVYKVVDGSDDELVGTASTYRTFNVTEAGKYYVVATTTSTSYSNSQASNEVEYGGTDTLLMVDGSVDAIVNHDPSYGHVIINLADSVDLNKYYTISVKVNTSSTATLGVDYVLVIGCDNPYVENDDLYASLTLKGDTYTGEVPITSSSILIQVACGKSAGMSSNYYDTVGITVTLEEGTMGDYTPPQQGDDDEEVLSLYGSVYVTIPAGSFVEIIIDDELKAGFYLITVFCMDIGGNTIWLTDSMGFDDIAFDDTGMLISKNNYFLMAPTSIYLKSNAEEDLGVTVSLYPAEEDSGEVGEGELAKGHDVTTTTDSHGTATIPYAAGVGATGTKQYLVQIVINNASQNLSGYTIKISNDEGEDEYLEYDANTDCFTVYFTPYGDYLHVTVTYSRSGVEVSITVSLLDNEGSGGGDDDEGSEIYNGWLTTITLAWNTPDYTMTVYGAGIYKFGLSSLWDSVTVELYDSDGEWLADLEFGEDGFATYELAEGTYTIHFTYYGAESARVNFMWDTPDNASWEYFPGEIDDGDDEGEEYPELMRDLSESVTDLPAFEEVYYTFTGDVDSGNTYKIVIEGYTGSNIADLFINHVISDEDTEALNPVDVGDGKYEIEFTVEYESQFVLQFRNFAFSEVSFTITIVYVA